MQPQTRARRVYRGTSLIEITPLSGPYSRTPPRVIWWSYGGGVSYERGTPAAWRLLYSTPYAICGYLGAKGTYGWMGMSCTE